MTTAFPGYPINARGWTMLELVIALIILAILVALAIPAYNNQIIKARRADGHALLFEAAQREQQFFTANNTYTSTIGSGGLDMSATSQEGYYTLSVATTATTYTLTATRVSPQTADTYCGNLTLTHQGVKGVTNATWTADRCW
jgi:type IV pilus assembly protein PilE